MEKIYILGNSKDRCEKINAEFVELPSLVKTDDAIHEYVSNQMANWDFDKLVFDITDNAEIALMLAFHLRLSLKQMGLKALCPILFVSEGLTIESYLQYGVYSQLFLTKGVYFSSIQDAVYDINAIEKLTQDTYKSCFWNIVHIEPDAKTGRHSLANQWGASILDKVAGTHAVDNNGLIQQSQKTLYFKYITAQNYIQELQPKDTGVSHEFKEIDATGKRVLLIDDEADKGWADVLRKLIKVKNPTDFDVISEKVSCFEKFTEDAKDKIENGKYDLFLLDLRLNGTAEEDIYAPADFSGMRILEKIKLFNKGNQVIMFTASNKAWNLKALLDEGADGYYIKESPEYKFSTEFSEDNYKNFRETIETCLNRSYLKGFVNKINNLPKDSDFDNLTILDSYINLSLLGEERTLKLNMLNLCVLIEKQCKSVYPEGDDNIKEIINGSKSKFFFVKDEKNKNLIVDVVFFDKLYTYIEFQQDLINFTKVRQQYPKSDIDIPNVDSHNHITQIIAALRYYYELSEEICKLGLKFKNERNKAAHGGKIDFTVEDLKKVFSEIVIPILNHDTN